jgi:hypothetical protein
MSGHPSRSSLRQRGWRPVVVLVCISGIAGSSAVGQEIDRPTVTAVRLADSAAIDVDGRLDEDVWRTSQVATGLKQREPFEGQPATERTEVRIAYDRTTLYVGVAARSEEPDKIISRILQRDRIMEITFDGTPLFTGDDAIALVFDPFHDHRNAFVFATNPNGAQFDALITDEGRGFNVDWRGVWEVRAQRTDEGWSAEFAIPFRTLRYPSDDRIWGFNIYRVIRQKNEEVLWSAWSRANEGFTRVSRAGHLEDLHDLPRSGVNLEVKPYVLGGATQEQTELEGIDTEPTFEAGLDLKYEVHPGLLLDATLNTDFAQVEVDDEQVNLTRFSLFLPEKRDFFLENAGIFEFGSRGFFEPTPPFLLFFSRQIGINDDEDDAREVPVIGGARLTGRVGGQTVGLLNLVTDAAFGRSHENFAVARVKRDIGASSYVGAMVTDRRSSSEWNTAAGLDGSFWPIGPLNVQGFVARTAAAGDGGDGTAYRVGFTFETDRWGAAGEHIYIAPDATADMGFITRDDIRRSTGFVRATARPPTLGLRRIDAFVAGDHVTRTDNLLQDWQAGFGINPQWNSGESVVLFYQRGFTRLDESFDLEDVEVPSGDYDTWNIGWFGNTASNRPIVLESNGQLQSIYDGHILSVSTSLSVTPDPHLAMSLSYTRNDVDLPAGAFAADIGSLRLAYAFSTRLFLNALLQYNSLDNQVSANIRLNWIHRPGSDVFIVINEERGVNGSLWDLSDRGAVIKITYLARI